MFTVVVMLLVNHCMLQQSLTRRAAIFLWSLSAASCHRCSYVCKTGDCISLTHQRFSFYSVSLSSRGSGHALQGAVACRKTDRGWRERERERERERGRVEGEGGGCLQADNTLNHRWLSKAAREWGSKSGSKYRQKERERDRRGVGGRQTE